MPVMSTKDRCVEPHRESLPFGYAPQEGVNLLRLCLHFHLKTKEPLTTSSSPNRSGETSDATHRPALRSKRKGLLSSPWLSGELWKHTEDIPGSMDGAGQEGAF